MNQPGPTAQASATFRISPSEYFRLALAERKWMAAGAGPAVIIIGFIVRSVVAGDVRPAIIALILLFIAVPMVMSMVYFSIAFSPQAARSTLPHTVELRNDGSILIRYVQPDDGGCGGHAPLPKDELITADQIKSLRRTSRHLVYRLHKGVLVIVPLEAVKLSGPEACSVRDFD